MYGDFSDVTADEFLAVQLDMSEFRLSWDRSAAQCGLVDTDPAGPGIIYHWEVNWPRFFSNRDYCCYRYRHAQQILAISHKVYYEAVKSLTS